jgi:hypothetical protein
MSNNVLVAGMQLPPNYGITYIQKFQAIFTLSRKLSNQIDTVLLAGLVKARFLSG